MPGDNLRIGIDVRALSFGETGFSRYILNLLENLSQIDSVNTYILYLNYHEPRLEVFAKSRNFTMRVIRAPFLFYKLLLLPLSLIKDKINIFHSMTHDLPFFVFCKKVITFYDLNLELLPQLYVLKLRLLSYLKISKRSAFAADEIIAISENTKGDLVKFYGINPEKIKVTLLSVDSNFCQLDKDKARKIVANKFGIHNHFILYVGQIRIQKNVPRLLEAYSKLIEEGLKEDLVLLGRHNTGSEFYDLDLEVKKRRLQNRVFHVSNCSTTLELVSFYNSAELLVYPSLYEGFGLPVLEAMACGIPVAASNIASLPEVVGDAGILFNPYNVDEIIQAIEKIISNVELKSRLVAKGLRRIKEFSWRKTAQETLSLYQGLQ